MTHSLKRLLERAQFARNKETWTGENQDAMNQLIKLHWVHFGQLVEALEELVHATIEADNPDDNGLGQWSDPMKKAQAVLAALEKEVRE